MKNLAAASLMSLALFTSPVSAQSPEVGISPWGAEDEIGRLNMMTDATRGQILSRISGGKAYDLSVEYYVGMPSWHGIGDPRYQYWLTHTPHGTLVDDPLNVGHAVNHHVSYTGDAVSMYTHMGTHIDALNHFGLKGRIWNGFEASQYLGDKGWKKTGAETIPPIIARGVMIDVPAAMGLEELPANYRVRPEDLQKTLDHQNTELREGDVVLIRTGRMQHYHDEAAYVTDAPGLDLSAAKWLVEEKGAMLLGADNLSFEAFPSQNPEDYVPVHTYLLAQKGVMIMELVLLEELSRDGLYEFAFIGGSLKFRGASAAPMRPIALPLN